MMNEVKRFILWLIENDIAFTHIAEAVETFRKSEKDESAKESHPYMGTDGTTEQDTKYEIYL